MEVFKIAFKNMKALYKNIPLLIFLVVMPIFQIYMIKSAIDNAIPVNTSFSSFVECIILSQNKSITSVNLVASGLLVQFLLMTGTIAGSIVVGEREQNTLMRLYSTPITKGKLLGGILLGQCFSVLILAIIIISTTSLLFEIHWGDSWLNIIIITLLAVYVASSLAFVVSGVFKSQKIAGGVATSIIVVMTLLSGGLIQSNKLDVISKFTINKWISDAFLKLMGGQTIGEILPNIIMLLLMGTFLMTVSIMVYRRENIYE